MGHRRRRRAGQPVAAHARPAAVADGRRGRRGQRLLGQPQPSLRRGRGYAPWRSSGFATAGWARSSPACRRNREFTPRCTSTDRTARRSASRPTAARRSSPGMSAIAEPPLNDLWTIPGEEDRLARFQAEDRARFHEIDAVNHYHALQIQDFLRAIIEDRPPAGDRRRRPPRRGPVPGHLPVQPRGKVDQAGIAITQASTSGIYGIPARNALNCRTLKAPLEKRSTITEWRRLSDAPRDKLMGLTNHQQALAVLAGSQDDDPTFATKGVAVRLFVRIINGQAAREEADV